MTSLAIREPIPNPAYALPQRPTRLLHHLPGPSARWLDGLFAEFLRDDARCIERLTHEFGPVFSLPLLFGGRAVMMTGVEANRLVLGNADENFSNHGGYAGLRLFGEAVVTRDFEDHRELRKIVASSFSASALRGYLNEINSLTSEAIGQLADVSHQRVEIYTRAKSLALQIAARVFAGLDLGPQQARMNDALVAALAMPGARIPFRIPGTAYDRGWRGLRYAKAYFTSRVASRREPSNEPHEAHRADLFSRLCQAENERGERLSDSEVADNAVGALIAGHDTSTIAIAALAHELARHPAWQDRVRADCLKAVEGSTSGWLDFDRAGTLDSVEWCVQETLRLYTPIRYLGRRSIRDFEFAGQRVPGNAAIMVSLHHTHHDERVFDRASEFIPERFAPASDSGRFDSFAWAPFGKGAHVCLGMGFAMLEIKAFFCALLSRYRLSVPSGHRFDVGGLPVSKPVDGVPLDLTRL